MTNDQVRVRVTVTATNGRGDTYRRSSIVERIENDDTTRRVANWVDAEAGAQWRAIRSDMRVDEAEREARAS